MSQGKSINLFDTKASLSPTWQRVEKYLLIARKYLLGFVLITGIICIVTFVVVRFRTSQLEAEQTRLSQQIQQQNVKEGMLLALRARISSLKKILAVQFSVAPYIDTTLLLARPPRLVSFSIGENSTVQISVDLPDIYEAVSIMKKITSMVDENQIRNPNLTSLTVDKDGSITLGISYSVLLKSAL